MSNVTNGNGPASGVYGLFWRLNENADFLIAQNGSSVSLGHSHEHQYQLDTLSGSLLVLKLWSHDKSKQKAWVGKIPGLGAVGERCRGGDHGEGPLSPEAVPQNPTHTWNLSGPFAGSPQAVASKTNPRP